MLSHLRQGLLRVLFPSDFPAKFPCVFLFPSNPVTCSTFTNHTDKSAARPQSADGVTEVNVKVNPE